MDLTAIVLTKDERLHIRRCLERLKDVARKVYVVDSLSTDGTQDIARQAGAEVVEHKWPGNQAAQFNWALDNLPIDSEWVLRMDADEYLTPELIDELNDILPKLKEPVNALVLPLGRCFMSRRLKHGIVNGVSMIRIFRRGKARYEQRLMDEHLKLTDGVTYTCRHPFIDDNRMPLSNFTAKHNNYSTREAVTLLDAEYGLFDTDDNSDSEFAREVKAKRRQKERYARMPLFIRAAGYFFYRYVVKLGFLDGKEGFLWDFLQGWWYRTLVDAKVWEIKRKASNDREAILRILDEDYGIRL